MLTISDPKLRHWSYAASKIAGESAVFSGAFKTKYKPVVIRFHNVYGERMGSTHVIPELLDRVRAKVDPFPIYGADQTRSFLHVEDAARAVILAASAPGPGGLFNVGSDEEVVIEALARMIFEITGFKPRLDYRNAPPGSVKRRAANVRKLAALGFSPTVSLEDGIRRCWTMSGRKELG
jgi:UDP-glucose 4-epimerase/UDP-glucuronate decarboxylase